MWAIIKFKENNFETLKKDLRNKLGFETRYYFPKIETHKYCMNKLVSKKVGLLGNYVFCFNEKFKDISFSSSIKYSKGLREILISKYSQNEICLFIKKCKDSENKNGFISQSFYELCEDKNYLLNSGPFAKNLIHVLKVQKNKIKALLGNIQFTFNTNSNLLNKV